MKNQTDLPSSLKGLEIAKELRRLAIRRGTDVEVEAYAVFVEDLSLFHLDDIAAACKVIGSEPRKSFEKPFPEVGVLIEECKRQESMRRNSSGGKKGCKLCTHGMELIFNEKGWSLGVVPCRNCGAPSWFDDSLWHNHNQESR